MLRSRGLDRVLSCALATLAIVGLVGCRAASPAGCFQHPTGYTQQVAAHYWEAVSQDHANYYSPQSLKWMAVGFGGGAIVANTNADQAIQDWYQDDVRSRTTDDVSRAAKQFGEGSYILPAFGAAFLLGGIGDDTATGSVLGEWGDRGLRAAIVGAPPMLFAQVATGASRPGETSAGSRWKPFDDNNGVAGHAFIGALPFLTAANMTADPWAKGSLYFCSTWAGWSRINDDAHFFSQTALGWMMAYMACQAVDRTQSNPWGIELLPVLVNDTMGLGAIYEF